MHASQCFNAPLYAPTAEYPERLLISSTFQDHLPCNRKAAQRPCIYSSSKTVHTP